MKFSMARRLESNRLVFTLLALLLIFLAGLAATSILSGLDSTGNVSDTSTRKKLLYLKSVKPSTIGSAGKNMLYSSNVYDIEIDRDFSGQMPWADLVKPGPDGSYVFTWRMRLSRAASFTVNAGDGEGETFSLRLSDRSGAPLYAKAQGLEVPTEEVHLEPGIYVLDAVSTAPLDFFSVNLKTSNDKAPPPAGLQSIHFNIGALDQKDLRRLADLSLSSTKGSIVKMASGKVKASLVNGEGRAVTEARIGLSGRTREHLDWFPSVDVKLSGGTFNGIQSFKLYRLETKSGLLDFVFLSLFKDMGYLVPRQDVVRLYINGEYMGLYILMETPSPAMFASQRLVESNILGVHTEKMFFDYPYGAELDVKYFYRVKDQYKDKMSRRFFISRDFSSMLHRDSFARFLAFSSIFHSSHGLGVDDLRFYENPATGLLYPLPRDLNPGLWYFLGDYYKSYGSHLAWELAPPLYTIWPLKRLLSHDYLLDRDGSRLSSPPPLTTGIADIHFAISAFVSDTANLELANKYLKHYLDNMAMQQKVMARVGNTLKWVLGQEPSDELLNYQLKMLVDYGIPFFGEFIKNSLLTSPPLLTNGKRTYRYNLRTSASLSKDLMPSLLSPVREDLEGTTWQTQLVRAFLCEKRIFEMIEDAGIELPGRTFAPVKGVPEEAISMTPAASGRSKADVGKDNVSMNVATYLGTHQVADDRALLIFLVRNATEDAADYKVVMRDGLSSFDPAVNTTFKIRGGGPAKELAADKEIVLSHFSDGELLRLLVFVMNLGKKAQFYTLSIPEGGKFYFPPYMYLPTRSSAVTERHAAGPPDGIIKTSEEYFIPESARVEIKEDLLVPEGTTLRVGKGAIITMLPSASIKVQGDFIVEGTKDRRVRFVGKDGRTWTGIYVGGSHTRNVKVVLKNVDFADYGEFPKTRVGDNYLNGGITLNHADALIDGAAIIGAGGEDALNAISSTVRVKDTSIKGAFSDAVDLDFSTAYIEGLRIESSGGDGLDVSSSLVEVRASVFAGSKDKGISIGEMSTVTIEGSTFENNDMGIANKDQSRLVVSGSRFDGNRIALAEFIKKPYFARPSSLEKNNLYNGNKKDYAWLGFFRY